MRCCIDCFKDVDVRERIRTSNAKGKCDICPDHTRNQTTFTLDLDQVSETSSIAASIANDLEEIVGLYELVLELPNSKELPSGSRHTLVDSLKDDWDIFNLNASEIGVLIELLLKNLRKETPRLFREVVIASIELDRRAKANKHSWRIIVGSNLKTRFAIKIDFTVLCYMTNDCYHILENYAIPSLLEAVFTDPELFSQKKN